MKQKSGTAILLLALVLVVGGMIVSIAKGQGAGIFLIGGGFVLYLIGKRRAKLMKESNERSNTSPI